MSGRQAKQNRIWERAGAGELRRSELLAMALKRSDICVALQNDALEYLFVANAPEGWQADGEGAPDDGAFFGPAISGRLSEIRKNALQSDEPDQFETVIPGDRCFRFIAETVRSTDGATRVLTTIIDISEERRRETVLRSLLREVSHRSKNLLAIIQSIAAMTARHSSDTEAFLQKFRGRLHSLSMSQDLVTDSNWRGALFRDLVDRQLQRYVPETVGAISVRGDNPLLTPNASLHIGLALHELIINAVTHGNLTAPSSAVTVSCQLVPDSDGDRIEFTWREDVSLKGQQPEAVEPVAIEKQRVGALVLERILPASVNGRAKLEIDGDELLYRLDFETESQSQKGRSASSANRP